MRKYNKDKSKWSVQMNPRHPGEIIRNRFMEPLNLRATDLAKALDVSHASISRIVNCKSAISPEMAVRLHHVLGIEARTWMNMQTAYDLSVAVHQVDLTSLRILNPPQES
jgi:addiction module HigA family antidote